MSETESSSENSEAKETESKAKEEVFEPPFSVDDRVKRPEGVGCLGVVTEVREEVTLTQGSDRYESLMIKVLWDNGTCSYHAPSAIEAAK